MFAQPRRLSLFGVSAPLLPCNWPLYVYAIHSGQGVEASLGCSINPIVNLLLGVLVLLGRLNRAQWTAVSFGFYGPMRETVSPGARHGLALQALLLAPVVLTALLWWTQHSGGAMAKGAAALDT